jgi:glycosyltransferase involved in cell wall biosynthesis
MRIAFYAPLKSPTHAVPSGDRRMAGLIIEALSAMGHSVDLASTLRSFEGEGDTSRQAAIRLRGAAEAAALVRRYVAEPKHERPEAWFTYHLYHKAPDWLGPEVGRTLRIPYLVAEASFAPKQANGRWADGHAAVAAALERADAVLALTADDVECLRNMVRTPDRLLALPPFLDVAPYRVARTQRLVHRARIAQELGLDADRPWLLAAAMMRAGDKLASYRLLADALERRTDDDWQLIVVGAGPAQAEVVKAFRNLGAKRVVYGGSQPPDAIPAICAAADIFVWPAVNEAYGMAVLEAQAAGLPVVAGHVRGVGDIVRSGRTGILTPPGDAGAFAAAVSRLLADHGMRARLGAAAAAIVDTQHGMAAGIAALEKALAIAIAGS